MVQVLTNEGFAPATSALRVEENKHFNIRAIHGRHKICFILVTDFISEYS